MLLADGRVLAVSEQVAAVYTMATNSWVAIGALPVNAKGAELIALADGGALLAGGQMQSLLPDPFAPTRQALRYDPTANSWVKAADMPTGRQDYPLVALDNGQILAIGGDAGRLPPGPWYRASDKVERYDPASGTWTNVAPLLRPRMGHTATRLADSRVLVAGGSGPVDAKQPDGGYTQYASAEIYDPATNSWQAAAPMSISRDVHTATLLQDGTVLVASKGSGNTFTAERYDPAKNSWSDAGSPATVVSAPSATLLLSGVVLFAGGYLADGKTSAIAQRYLPSTNSWQPIDSLSAPRAGHGAVLVNGQVLVVGGSATGNATSAERYDATTPETVCQWETGHCMSGAFLAQWQQLAINGYALSDPFPERLEDDKVYLVQYFERVRMEYHPENAAPFQVLLGQFGRRLHPADPAVAPQAGGTFFAPTGHNVSGGFLAYWQANDGLAQFGYPLSEVLSETLENGQVYQVQYFERARFEYHPENTAPNDVLLGQFGRQILAGR